MHPDLDRKLCERYPLMFRNRNNVAYTMGRGFECGDGWYALIDAACAVATASYEKARFAYEKTLEAGEDADAVELARTEMEVQAELVPVALQVKEKLGSLRIYLGGDSERARAAREFAEILSESVCELCAKPGQSLEAGGVLRTRCAEHEREPSGFQG